MALFRRFRSGGGRRSNRHKPHVKDENRVCRHDGLPLSILHGLCSVAQRRRYRHNSLAPHLHSVHADLEAWNKPWLAKDEGERLVPVCLRAVKDGAILKPSHVENGNSRARGRFGALSYNGVLDLHVLGYPTGILLRSRIRSRIVRKHKVSADKNDKYNEYDKNSFHAPTIAHTEEYAIVENSKRVQCTCMEPLASRIRPETLGDFFGQEHLI